MVGAGRHHSRDGSRRNGNGESHVVGVVHRRDSGHCDRIRSAANRDLGSRHVRRLGEDGERTQSRADCRSPVRGRHTAADAVGRDLLGAALQHGVHAGGVPPDEKSAGASALRADSRRVRAALRARCTLLRSGAALGADSAAGAVCEPVPLEGQQLPAAGPRSAGPFGSTPARDCRGSHMIPRAAAVRREFAASERIPYTAHVAPTVVRTAFGDYLTVFRLGGASFESNDDEELNNWHQRLNVLWRNIGSANVALWTQVIRRRAGISSSPETAAQGAICSFAGALHERYRSRLANETLMMNEVYLAVVYRPTSGVPTGLASKILARAQRDGSRLGIADALDACEKLSQTVAASLARYEPEILGTYL